jgi:hypothetical protein
MRQKTTVANATEALSSGEYEQKITVAFPLTNGANVETYLKR